MPGTIRNWFRYSTTTTACTAAGGCTCSLTRPTPTRRRGRSSARDASRTPFPGAATNKVGVKAKGSRGGRPPKFDQERYAEPNTIERGFGRLKQWRGIATRYDKYALTFLGGVLLAATLQYRR